MLLFVIVGNINAINPDYNDHLEWKKSLPQDERVTIEKLEDTINDHYNYLEEKEDWVSWTLRDTWTKEYADTDDCTVKLKKQLTYDQDAYDLAKKVTDRCEGQICSSFLVHALLGLFDFNYFEQIQQSKERVTLVANNCIKTALEVNGWNKSPSKPTNTETDNLADIINGNS
jgi:hypothetical protein